MIYNRLKKAVILALCLALGFGVARAEVADRFLGTWTAEGIEVVIRRERDDYLVTAEFRQAPGEVETWEYGPGWYDAQEDAIWCGSIVRTHYHYDGLTDQMEETDWSLDDMNFAHFTFNADGATLTWTDDGMNTPMTLSRQD